MRLPLETVLRRGHVAALSAQPPRPVHNLGLPTLEPAPHRQPHLFKTVVPVGPYRGVWGTVWYIVREEGTTVSHVSAAKSAALRSKGKDGAPPQKTVTKKGQGVAGLWRGWRVGFWGLVGVWGAATLGGGGSGGEF